MSWATAKGAFAAARSQLRAAPWGIKLLIVVWGYIGWAYVFAGSDPDNWMSAVFFPDYVSQQEFLTAKAREWVNERATPKTIKRDMARYKAITDTYNDSWDYDKQGKLTYMGLWWELRKAKGCRYGADLTIFFDRGRKARWWKVSKVEDSFVDL